MARTEKTSSDLREFSVKVSEIAKLLSAGADMMDKNEVPSILAHGDDIVRRILPSLSNWAINLDSEVRKAVASKAISGLADGDASQSGKKRVGRPRRA